MAKDEHTNADAMGRVASSHELIPNGVHPGLGGREQVHELESVSGNT